MGMATLPMTLILQIITDQTKVNSLLISNSTLLCRQTKSYAIRSAKEKKSANLRIKTLVQANRPRYPIISAQTRTFRLTMTSIRNGFIEISWLG